MDGTGVIRYEFGDYSLLPSERLLLRGGEPVPLKPKVFDTLLTLVQHRRRLLSRDELIGLIWPGRIVEEGNLSQNIFTLRKLLGERPHEHRFIVTVPGQGYRFVAKVKEVLDEESASAPGSAGGGLKSLAVLPLKSLPPTEDESYLGLVIADTLITRLNSGSGISVRPTTAILKYTRTDEDPLKVGRELVVDVVVDGTVRWVGEKVRVNLQMVDVRTRETIWAGLFEAATDDLVRVEDSIAEQVVAALKVVVRGGGRRGRAPADIETYQTYVKGRFFWDKRTEEGLKVGLACAREVVAAEPDFALGHVGMADSYLLMGEYSYAAPEEAFPAALAAVQQALSLNPELGEAQASLAEYLFFYEWDWARAEEHYQRALRLSPDYATARHWYTWFLCAMGRFEEAAEQIRRAQMLDHGSIVLYTMVGMPFYFRGDYRRAIEQFRRTLEMDLSFGHVRYYLGSALAHSGRYEEAAAQFEEQIAADPIQQALGLLGYCYARSGRAGRAREMLARLDELEGRRHVSPYVRAFVHVGLGETGEALSQLEKTYERRSPWMVWLNVDPFFGSLRSEPRFVSLLDRLGFKR